MTGGEAAGSLEHTPTWAVATVCFLMISVSILLEHSIHIVMKWLKTRHRTVLYDAFGRLKSELMLLGFISLLLTVTQSYISNICVPPDVANRMLPCGREVSFVDGHWAYENGPFVNNSKFISRRLSDTAAAMKVKTTDPCTSKGKIQLITAKGIEQLEHFIIVLAVMQIMYSILTVSLGRIKMRRWKVWEKETQTTDYSANDRFRLPRQTTFLRRHTTCTETSPQLWIKCFLRQFFSSVAKTDYHTLRKGFIMAHLSVRQLNSFNFQKYIEYSLDEDFKVVISISPLMWFTVVIFMLVDIHGWHSYMWISFVPLLLIIAVGTKLEMIVARMALQLKNQKNMIYGAPLVELNDSNFWFGKPGVILHLLHMILFLNAFEIAFFIWVTIEFGSDSCYHDNATTIVRIVLAVAIQVICSYVTLPLYALVGQMGSQFKGEIFNEKVAQVLKQWHIQVRRNRKKNQEHSLGKSPATTSLIMTSYEKEGFAFNNTPTEFTAAAETSNYGSENISEITEEHGT